MKRTVCLGVLIAVGGFSLAVSGFQGRAERPRPPIRRIQQVKDNLYVILGGNPGDRDTWTGGNTAVFVTANGVVVVDSMNPGFGQSILKEIKTVTPKPVTTLINTHTHGDHTGSNTEFPANIDFVAQENTKANMQKMDAFKGPNAKFLPSKTVTDRLTLLDGPDRIDLYYFGRGHTNGDLIVVFPEKRLAHFGDLFPAKAAPFIDTANGGSAVELPKTLAKAIAEIKGVSRVVTGHDESSLIPAGAGSGSAIFANPKTMTWNDVQEYADFNRDFLAAVEDAIKAGKSAAEAVATLQLPERYKAYDMQRAKENVEAIYRELGK